MNIFKHLKDYMFCLFMGVLNIISAIINQFNTIGIFNFMVGILCLSAPFIFYFLVKILKFMSNKNEENM